MKSKLFLSLSLLTAVFSMNANSITVFNALSVPTKVSTFRNPFVQMGALCAATASTVAGSLYGVSQYQKNAEQNQFDINAELIKADNLELRKQRAYKLEAARNTRFAQFKAQLNNGLSIAKNYKKTSAVAGTAVVAGLGYMGYKKLAAKYAQAKTVTTPVVNTPVVETPVVKKALVAKKAVKKSTPSRRNNFNRRK